MFDHISEILIKHYQYLKFDSDSFKEYFLFQTMHIAFKKILTSLKINERFDPVIHKNTTSRNDLRTLIVPSIVITRHKISNQIQTDSN